MVFLRIAAGLAEVLASSIELVNDNYFRRDMVDCSSDYRTNEDENDSKRVVVEKKRTARQMNHEPIDITNGKCSMQKKKKKSETKKARGRAKISQLRHERLSVGLPVASEADGVWD